MNVTASLTGNTYNIELTDAPSGQYRARLFLNYSGLMSYSGDEGVGLKVNDGVGVVYDDWNCAFRPPRIDHHKFNCEIVVPLVTGVNQFVLSDSFDRESESSLPSQSVTNPVNILVEKKVSSVGIENIQVIGNSVTVVTSDDHHLNVGDAVTVDNQTYSSKHVLGPDGLRIIGTYQIVAVTDRSFTYQTKHYITPTNKVFLGQPTWTFGKWEAVTYTDTGIDETETEYGIVLDYGNRTPPVAKNDWVFVNFAVDPAKMQVDRAEGNLVYLNYSHDELLHSETLDVTYSPRTPSGAIPTNWVDEYESNPSQYDHTKNTYFVEPYVDTYFVQGDDTVHIGEQVLKCSVGDAESVICMKFPSISMPSDGQKSAELRMYLAKMNYSEATVALYQMDSIAWGEDMTYDEIMSHVTQIPVSSYELKNPGIMDFNEADPDNIPEKGDYNSYVPLSIDSAILSSWLSGSSTSVPSVCMRVISHGSPSIVFNSTESGSQVPYFVVTGGEASLLDPTPFDIVVTNSTVVPGNVMRIEVDEADASFGNSLFDNIVVINGNTDKPLTIVNGSASFIDVIVPDDVSGLSEVQVYRKVGNKVVPLTNTTTVYVNNDLTKRDIKLAEKKQPGVIESKTSTSAMYNRDLGYSNFKEVTDETSLLQNVYSCLLTNKGERLFNQNFGTHIEDRLFTLGSDADEDELLKECIQTVNQYEPRVTIDVENSSCVFDENGCYNLELAVVLPTARTEKLKITFKNRGEYV